MCLAATGRPWMNAIWSSGGAASCRSTSSCRDTWIDPGDRVQPDCNQKQAASTGSEKIVDQALRTGVICKILYIRSHRQWSQLWCPTLERLWSLRRDNAFCSIYRYRMLYEPTSWELYGHFRCMVVPRNWDFLAIKHWRGHTLSLHLLNFHF